MSTELRVKAMELAVTYGDTTKAQEIFEFLTGTPPAQPSQSSEFLTTPPATTRKRRSSAPAPSTSDASAPTAAASSTCAAEAPSGKAASGTSQASSLPSLDDVRYELTQCQGRSNGDQTVPKAILAKYAPSGTLGTLKDEDRAKVIAECRAVK
jgi:hypothetical protein